MFHNCQFAKLKQELIKHYHLSDLVGFILCLTIVNFPSNIIRVEHPNFLGHQTTYLQFELSNKVQSNIPHVSIPSRQSTMTWKNRQTCKGTKIKTINF
jgi:hypothetical protein